MNWLRRHLAPTPPPPPTVAVIRATREARTAVVESTGSIEHALHIRREAEQMAATMLSLRERNHFADTIQASILKGVER